MFHLGRDQPPGVLRSSNGADCFQGRTTVGQFASNNESESCLYCTRMEIIEARRASEAAKYRPRFALVGLQ